MKIQKCNSCKTKFHDKPWIDECPVCRSKNINHNEDGSLFEWHNYGDINFLKYGGCLVRETDYPEHYNVLWLEPEICDYKGKYKKPMMIAKCYVDLSDWLDKTKDIDKRKNLNYFLFLSLCSLQNQLKAAFAPNIPKDFSFKILQILSIC